MPSSKTDVSRGRGWPFRGPGDPVSLLAHRGGQGPWRENTLRAFRGALELGADGVELDVRRTSDGALVVLHDSLIEGLGQVHELMSDDLPGWLPTLGEALSACAGASVNVEIKNSPGDPGHDPSERIASEVLAELEASRMRGSSSSPSRVVVSSFSTSTIRALSSSGAGVALGQLVSPSVDVPAAVEGAAEAGCSAVHVLHLQVDEDLVGRVHEHGMAVVAWTVNGPERVAAMLGAGVDAIITDDTEGTSRAIEADAGLVRDRDPRGQSGS